MRVHANIQDDFKIMAFWYKSPCILGHIYQNTRRRIPKAINLDTTRTTSKLTQNHLQLCFNRETLSSSPSSLLPS